MTGTKIKFFMKGDTLVYNADAFQLQEGSMLDALISQLPGAELDSDGRINVNGQLVESLMLNGRDFFKGDNTVLLDNLPAYMVQQVQVYNKESELSKAVGTKVDEGDLVMDVKLKKKYAVGWLGNVELGYATKERYLSRLFAMRYTPQSRITLFGNMNNVNDRRKPDGNGGWGSVDPTGGLTATKRAGMDYSVYDKLGKYEVSGNAGVTYSDNANIWGGNSTNFVTGGDTYESTRKNTQSSNLSISISHKMTMQIGNRGNISLQPSFNYYKNDYTSEFTNGTFSAQPTEDYATVLDSLFSPEWATTVRNMIKRNGEWAEGDGHGSSGELSTWGFYKPFPYSTDGIYFDASIAYSDKKAKRAQPFHVQMV